MIDRARVDFRGEVRYQWWRLWYWNKYERGRYFWRDVANRMPAPLVYWAGIRLWSYMTSGPRGNVHPDSVTFSDALQTWDKEKLDNGA